MAAGLAAKRGRGRPVTPGAEKTTKLAKKDSAVLRAHNVAKKELREANKHQDEVKSSELEQKRQDFLKAMQERILKNKS